MSKTKITQWHRPCPGCGEIIYHSTQSAMKAALKRISIGSFKGECGTCRSTKMREDRRQQQLKETQEFYDWAGKQSGCIPTRTKSRGNTQIVKLMEYHHGPRPKGYVICHLCENDSCAPNGFTCCNPNHLMWGTVQQNIQHQWEKCPDGNRVRDTKGRFAAK